MVTGTRKYERLREDIQAKCREIGVLLDTYDADFLLGGIMSSLDKRDEVLTGQGVRKLKREV